MNHRRSLSQILNTSDRSTLRQAWNKTEAADELKPLPAGEYVARILSGELDTARTGTLGYKLTFEVAEGEHAGRRFWHDVWLTPAALPLAKRDLLKLGVTDLDMLDRPLPQGIRVTAKVALRRNDDGTESNRVKTFDVIGVEPPDPFAPEPSPQPGTGGGHVPPPAAEPAVAAAAPDNGMPQAEKGGDDDLPI